MDPRFQWNVCFTIISEMAAVLSLLCLPGVSSFLSERLRPLIASRKMDVVDASNVTSRCHSNNKQQYDGYQFRTVLSQRRSGHVTAGSRD